MAQKDSKIIAVVPAYNEAKTIGLVIPDLKRYVQEIIVVNDGSFDETEKIAKFSGVIVLSHAINRGLGASLQTGFKKALEKNADYILTFDADGQHRSSDIPRLLESLEKEEADVAIGSRIFSKKNTPLIRKIYNKIADYIGFVIFGLYVRDTQSGLRLFRKDALMKLRPLGDRMEISSEIIGEIGRLKLKIVEVPIQEIYTDYSLSKGQSFKNGVKTFFSLIWHKLIR